MVDWLQHTIDFIPKLFNPESIIKVGGLFLLCVVVFAETGLLVGFFLPGDSLLFTSGLLSANPAMNLPLWQVLVFVTLAAIIGDSVGYYIGKVSGPKIFQKKESWLFKPEYVIMTKEFYSKHGAKTLILGRFLPVIRTFAPVLAGVIRLNYTKFLSYNIIGGWLWVWSLALIGYFFGSKFPWIKDYYEYIVIGFIVVTTIPVIRMFLSERKKKKVEGNIEEIEANFQAKMQKDISSANKTVQQQEVSDKAKKIKPKETAPKPQ